MSDSYFEQLEKIANEGILADSEPMNEDPAPAVAPEDVEKAQALNAEESAEETNDLHPLSPEETEALESAVNEAEEGMEASKEASESDKEAMDKAASFLNDNLKEMGALAKLIDFSTNEEVDEPLRKLASDRLLQALESDEDYNEVIDKTANEIFEDEENLQQLYSDVGLEYVTTHLASFVEDEELEKTAMEVGGIFRNIRDRAGEALDAAKNLRKLHSEVKAADAHLDQVNNELFQHSDLFNKAVKTGDPDQVKEVGDKVTDLTTSQALARLDAAEVQNKFNQGAAVAGTAGVGGAGGSILLGKKIHDSSQKDSDDELLTREASGTINQEDIVNETKGGKYKMADNVVKDFLKVAGAAHLINLAYREDLDEGIRKQAGDTFNAISRMGRKEMDENFVKVATEMYTEEELHEVVAGKHNDFLFDKVANFIEANDLSVDELEKVAGAEGVAAKGVGGSLSDAKKNIEAKIDSDKKKTETVANGETGSKKADDMRGYNVINNPGEYQVEKSASDEMLQDAYMRKEAAFQEYVKLDTFIRNNSKEMQGNA